MIVHKFGGATTRTAKGLETLVELARSAHSVELRRARRMPATSGFVIVVSAIGHTTRNLQRAAELARTGNFRGAEEYLERVTMQHAQLLAALRFPEVVHQSVTDEFRSLYQRLRALIEGINITRELSMRTRDNVMGHGERFAIVLLAALLQQRGIPTVPMDARTLIVTNEAAGHAAPLMEETCDRLRTAMLPKLVRGNVVLIEGFVAATRDGIPTTMGSESSDLTATLIAKSLGASEVVIWKNVAGILNADPELVQDAKLIRTLTISEADEIGRRGARVLFADAAAPLAGLEPAPVLRIASPVLAIRSRTGTSKSSTIVNELPQAVRSTSPLAVALEHHLAAIRLHPKLPTINSTATPRGARRHREQLAMLGSSALYLIQAGDEHLAIVKREVRSELVESFGASFTLSEEAPVAAISLILRLADRDLRGALTDLRMQIARSLKAFAPIATFTSGASIISIVDDTSGEAATKKLHTDLLG